MMNMVQMDILAKEIEKRYVGVQVRIQPVLKNNTTLTGVTIQLPKQTISPCIYLEGIKGIDNMAVSEIADEIVRINAEHQTDAKEFGDITSWITDYEKVTDKLFVRVLPHNGNTEMLKTVVHESFLDLEIVPYIIVSRSDEGNATIKVTNEMAKQWKASWSEIISIAKANTYYEGFNCQSMGHIMAEMMDMPYDPMMDEQISMYVITNESKLNGAVAITSEKYMHNVAADLGDLLVLPSSIHEVIVVPMSKVDNIDDMTQMVQEINAGQVEPEEQLSDHAYVYRKEIGWEF